MGLRSKGENQRGKALKKAWASMEASGFNFSQGTQQPNSPSDSTVSPAEQSPCQSDVNSAPASNESVSTCSSTRDGANAHAEGPHGSRKTRQGQQRLYAQERGWSTADMTGKRKASTSNAEMASDEEEGSSSSGIRNVRPRRMFQPFAFKDGVPVDISMEHQGMSHLRHSQSHATKTMQKTPNPNVFQKPGTITSKQHVATRGLKVLANLESIHDDPAGNSKKKHKGYKRNMNELDALTKQHEKLSTKKERRKHSRVGLSGIQPNTRKQLTHVDAVCISQGVDTVCMSMSDDLQAHHSNSNCSASKNRNQTNCSDNTNNTNCSTKSHDKDANCIASPNKTNCNDNTRCCDVPNCMDHDNLANYNLLQTAFETNQNRRGNCMLHHNVPSCSSSTSINVNDGATCSAATNNNVTNCSSSSDSRRRSKRTRKVTDKIVDRRSSKLHTHFDSQFHTHFEMHNSRDDVGDTSREEAQPSDEEQAKLTYEERMDSLLPKHVCGVCSAIKAVSEMRKKTVLRTDTMLMPLLRENETTPLLCDAGISEDDVSVCLTCSAKLASGQMPTMSLANLDWGTVPPELACLSHVEKKMIALYNCNSTIFVLPGGQSGRLGGVAYVQNDLVATMQRLPRLPKETDTIFAVAPNRRFDKKMCDKRCEVRPHLIKRALLWLVKNNPLYKQADENNLIDYKLLDRLAQKFQNEIDPWNPDFDDCNMQFDNSWNPDFEEHNMQQDNLQLQSNSTGSEFAFSTIELDNEEVKRLLAHGHGIN
eukprot:CAMPEP_0173424170 /NCGR_PEP_ID=MMETSP1357-20121228/4145_1 /TAXON_ID=77926 /ORGANISM="Hemiselmis rufescens, Strain PCC563" /LENGTH=762 /DNA_ID=CAMNT_0014387345 /DNA_START=198 /DNA_END=2483 /DNA_ORIENTATION=+